jgi:hypothetical protein
MKLVQIEQLFNIIIDFPESEPAILDLKLCLEKTDLRTQLVMSLKSALETRLLHPGKKQLMWMHEVEARCVLTTSNVSVHIGISNASFFIYLHH